MSQGTKTDTPLQSTPIAHGAINLCTPYAQSAGSKNSCSLHNCVSLLNQVRL